MCRFNRAHLGYSVCTPPPYTPSFFGIVVLKGGTPLCLLLLKSQTLRATSVFARSGGALSNAPRSIPAQNDGPSPDSTLVCRAGNKAEPKEEDVGELLGLEFVNCLLGASAKAGAG